jgi:hypothetical protein
MASTGGDLARMLTLRSKTICPLTRMLNVPETRLGISATSSTSSCHTSPPTLGHGLRESRRRLMDTSFPSHGKILQAHHSTYVDLRCAHTLEYGEVRSCLEGGEELLCDPGRPKHPPAARAVLHLNPCVRPGPTLPPFPVPVCLQIRGTKPGPECEEGTYAVRRLISMSSLTLKLTP